jgi:hypothetical protein
MVEEVVPLMAAVLLYVGISFAALERLAAPIAVF